MIARWMATIGLALAGAGCSGRPAAVEPVAIHPARASRQAVEMYDQNGDGQLDVEELKAVPGIAKYQSLYDTDGNGSVSQDEIAERFRLWKTQELGFRQLPVLVLLDGRPLVGANIEFVPEPYLQPVVKAAKGVTGGDGTAELAVAQEDLPEQLAHLPISGVTGGTFKVKITHPEIELQPRFNTETVLGEEIAVDTVMQRSTIELNSR